MSEMLVTHAARERVVQDYDFIFSSGLVMPVTVDWEAGDSITFEDKEIIVKLSAKPQASDPSAKTPAETMTINRSHVLALQSRERVVRDFTPEEQFGLSALFKSMSDTVQ